MDYSATAIKSDKLIPSNLWEDLRNCATALEDIPDEQKDWHPGSDGLVLDLVHPSLWPLIYGQSRILPSKEIGIQDCIEACGAGRIIPKPFPAEVGRMSLDDGGQISALSARFQWLPCDVAIDDQGKVKIGSYINNLHPEKHASIYSTVERFIQLSLPAWDVVYQWPEDFKLQRVHTSGADYKCLAPEICGKCYECEPVNRMLADDSE